MDALSAKWGPLSEAVNTEMSAWRRRHPRATLTEIETALDACLHRLRAQMLSDLAQASPLSDLADLPNEEKPTCPDCGQVLQARGQKTRHLQTSGGQDLAITRSHATCPACGAGFFPLDNELSLLPGSLTPQAQAALVHLGAEWEFGPAAELLAALTGIIVSEATARRHTYAVGEVLLAEQTASAPALAPPADPGPDTLQRLQFSADGAMIPLVGGSWAEVKTLVIGEIQLELQARTDGAFVPEPHARQLSYFSRLLPADEFTRLAVVETHRRGVRAARAVGGVMDGAMWLQGLLDYHRPEAVRILDQPHALDHLHALAQAMWGNTKEAHEWWSEHKKLLNKQGPDETLKAMVPLAGEAQDVESYSKHRDYLEGRREQMRYGEFREAGWPVGSGIVESANKVVVERRLKGAGKRWAVEHVNPLLALRSELCSGRWAQSWAAGASGRRRATQAGRAARRAQRRGARGQGKGR